MPDVILVHGAWHGTWCWDGVLGELKTLGVSAAAVELPLTGLADDAAAARAAIEAAGPAVVVVGHSYGGSVISVAAAGLPGVVRLIYLAALLTETNAVTNGLISEELRQSLVADERGVTVDPAAAPGIFYGDADPAIAAEMVARLRPITPGATVPPDTEAAWKTVPATYVVCTNDQAIPVAAQRRMAEHAGTVIEWPTDHSPFVTRPAAVAELISRYV